METAIFLIEHVMPDWTLALLIFLGIFLPIMWFWAEPVIVMPAPYKLLTKIVILIVSIASVLFGTWAQGYIASKEEFAKHTEQLRIKAAALQKQQVVVTEQVEKRLVEAVTKIVYKNKNIIEYIEREVVKYDNSCAIGPEVFVAHDTAAQGINTITTEEDKQ